MNKAEVVRRIKEAGIIAVVRAPTAEEALQAAYAIRAGGLTVLEITLTVPGAEQVIERLAEAAGDGTTIGAGSVRNAEAARSCIDAGAQFIVSPVFDPNTLWYCRKQGVAAIPGALTPTEIEQAWTAGADLVKVFPAATVGGAAYIRALREPMPHVELLPTGGVTLATAASYIQAGAAAVGVGGELLDHEALRGGHADRVSATARAYAEAVRAARQAPGG